MIKPFSLLVLLGLLLLTNVTVAATQCTQQSAATRAVLLELFTSEGCSSCPPAERWLSNLVPQVFTSTEVVPLAFHVDYWDYLGWRDPFGDSQYTARQYAYTRMHAGAFAYTPQVVLQGQNYAAWYRERQFRQDAQNARVTAPRAKLQLKQQLADNNSVKLIVTGKLLAGEHADSVRLYAALYQNDIESDVIRGENGGSRLHHDFVVRSFAASSEAPDTEGRLLLKTTFNLPAAANPANLGIAIFAQDSRQGEVLQALAAPLCVN